ncbi:hypothetical protein VNI00_016947 [Paramarasmius palmivorus]|uniref:Uncharacterized protein n=1 Tax=Paramarasmius palmivorus TaxID=297713 RepID=A0AAW0BAT5_9AGAR
MSSDAPQIVDNTLTAVSGIGEHSELPSGTQPVQLAVPLQETTQDALKNDPVLPVNTAGTKNAVSSPTPSVTTSPPASEGTTPAPTPLDTVASKNAVSSPTPSVSTSPPASEGSTQAPTPVDTVASSSAGSKSSSGSTSQNLSVSDSSPTPTTAATSSVTATPQDQQPGPSGSSQATSSTPISAPEQSIAASDDGQHDDDDDVSRGVGNPGNFSGDRLAYMEEHLAQFLSYPARSEDRSDFWPQFFPTFLELFPFSTFTLPPSNPPPIPEYTPDQFAALTADERRSYRKKKKWRMRTPEERYKDTVKQWFRWRASRYVRKGSRKGISNVLAAFNRAEHAPRKRQVPNFVMSHPKYRARVSAMSTETDNHEILSCRRAAAETLYDQLTEEERQQIQEEIEAEHVKALEAWNERDGGKAEKEKGKDDNEDGEEPKEEELMRAQERAQEGFGVTMQELLNHLQAQTGLSFVLFAGQSLDGQDLFRSVTVQSYPEGNRGVQHFDFQSFREYAKVFHKWLREIYFRNHGSLSAETLDLIGRDVADSTVPVPLDQRENDHEPQPGNKGKGKAEPKKKKGSTKKKNPSADENENRASTEVREPEVIVNGQKGSPTVVDDPQSQKLSYEEQRERNIKHHREQLEQLKKSLNLPSFLTGVECNKGGKNKQPSRSRGKKRKQVETNDEAEADPDAEGVGPASQPTRKSKRSRKVVNYQEAPVEDEPTGNAISQSQEPEWRSQLLAERLRFIEDKGDVKDLVDLVLKTTPEDSDARKLWIKHASDLSEAWRERDPLNPSQWPEPPSVDLPTPTTSNTLPPAPLTAPSTSTSTHVASTPGPSTPNPSSSTASISSSQLPFENPSTSITTDVDSSAPSLPSPSSTSTLSASENIAPTSTTGPIAIAANPITSQSPSAMVTSTLDDFTPPSESDGREASTQPAGKESTNVDARTELLRARHSYLSGEGSEGIGVKEFMTLVDRLTAPESRSREQWTQHVDSLVIARRSRDGLQDSDHWPEPPADDVPTSNGLSPPLPPTHSPQRAHSSPDITMNEELSLMQTSKSPSPSPLPAGAPSEQSHVVSGTNSTEDACTTDVEIPGTTFTYAVQGIKDEQVRRSAEILLAKEHTQEWKSLVFLWLRVQSAWAKHGISGGIAPVRDRPFGFTEFGRTGRNRPGGLDVPEQSSLANLREVWPTWWKSSQPDGRVLSNGEIGGRVTDWSDLKLPGHRGFFMFLLGLRWWFDLEKQEAAGDHNTLGANLQAKGWNAATKSVYNTLLALLDDAGGENAVSELKDLLDELSVPASDKMIHTLKRQAVEELDDLHSAKRARDS